MSAHPAHRTVRRHEPEGHCARLQSVSKPDMKSKTSPSPTAPRGSDWGLRRARRRTAMDTVAIKGVCHVPQVAPQALLHCCSLLQKDGT